MEWLDQKDVCPLKCRICGKHGKFPNGICSRHDCPVHGNQKLSDKGECLVRCKRCGKHPDDDRDGYCAKHYCPEHGILMEWLDSFRTEFAADTTVRFMEIRSSTTRASAWCAASAATLMKNFIRSMGKTYVRNTTASGIKHGRMNRRSVP